MKNSRISIEVKKPRKLTGMITAEYCHMFKSLPAGQKMKWYRISSQRIA